MKIALKSLKGLGVERMWTGLLSKKGVADNEAREARRGSLCPWVRC